MLADFLPLLQEVQLQEEIVRELNQQVLQSKQRLTATQDESCDQGEARVAFHDRQVLAH